MAVNKELDFEQTLNQLENLVKQLESGELTLEESLKTFEKGIQLAHAGQQKLSHAEQRIQILLQKDTHAPLNDFVPSAEDLDEPSNDENMPF